jgi:hypothetical protein
VFRKSFLTVLGTVIAFAASPALAQDTMPPMPPGMTPAMMKMMMTNGPKNAPGMPKGAVPISGCIPAMGYHYAVASKGPTAPIYGWYKNRAVFTEVMPSKAAFEKGFDLNDIKPLPGYKIDHVDVWYEPNGHPGMMIPHYDIHAWYIPHSEHMTFCGNTSGKKPAFV